MTCDSKINLFESGVNHHNLNLHDIIHTSYYIGSIEYYVNM